MAQSSTMQDRSSSTAGSVRVPELHGVDHVELWVGNARQAMGWWCRVAGFVPVAYAGPETGRRDRVSWVVRQGDITWVLTSGLDPDGVVAGHVARHGDGVRRVAFRVDDAVAARRRAVAAGAIARGKDVTGPGDDVAVTSIAAWEDAEYTFVSRPDGEGMLLPGFTGVDHELAGALSSGPTVGLRAIDHVVVNVARGHLASLVDWHANTLGLRPREQFSVDVSTDRSALVSTVLADDAGTVILPVNEPAPGPRRSQIQEFLDAWRGPGVQHMALATDDIVATVAAMRARGMEFLPSPDGYHERVRDRVGGLDVAWDELRELDILVDRDDRGHLLQIFTGMLQDRPTLFLEIIQRVGARGFGAGNFGALFKSLEDAQERRGNL